MTKEVRARISRKREEHPNWKGGQYVAEGRVHVQVPVEQRHLFATVHPNGYIRRSHLVWNQHHPGDLVQPHEIIHHRNEDKLDDRIGNLEKMTQSEHARLHFSGKPKSAQQRARMSAAHQRRREARSA